MKINSIVILQLEKKENDILKETCTRSIAKIIASQLSLQEMNELVENLINNETLLIKSKQS